MLNRIAVYLFVPVVLLTSAWVLVNSLQLIAAHQVSSLEAIFSLGTCMLAALLFGLRMSVPNDSWPLSIVHARSASEGRRKV